MTQPYTFHIENTVRQILQLFRDFSANNDFGPDFFNTQPGSKIKDLLNYVYFLDRRLNAQQELSLSEIYEEITKYSDFNRKGLHKMFLLCVILDIFTDQKEKVPVNSFWPNFYKLLLDVRDKKQFLVEISAASISKYLLLNPEAVEDIFNSFTSTRNTINSIQFLSLLRLPEKLPNEQSVAITLTISKVLCMAVKDIPLDFIKTALLNISSQIIIQNESDIIGILKYPQIAQSSIINLLTSAIYITIPDAEVIANRIDDFIQFATTCDCLKQTFATIENFFNSITSLPAEKVDGFIKVLSKFSISIPPSPIQTENAAVRAAKFVKHLYELNPQVPFQLVCDYLRLSTINSDILNVLFSTKILGSQESWKNVDILMVSPIIENIVRSWDVSAARSNSIVFANTLILFLQKATEMVKSVKRIDDNTAMQNIMKNKVDDIEEAISNLPFEQLQSMCTVMTFHKDKDMRLAAYNLLIQTAELFKVANTDWKDYSLDEQPFIIRFNSEFNYVTKRMFGKPRDIISILSEEGIRIDCSTNMFKKIAASNHPLSKHVFTGLVKYSEQMPWFIEGVSSMYSMEMHNEMTVSFLRPEKFIQLLITSKNIHFIARMSGTAFPLIIPHINFDIDLESLASIIRYIILVWDENPKSFSDPSCKPFLDKVIALFDEKPDITRCNDYVIALGLIASLVLHGMIDPIQKMTEFYVVVLTAVQRDTLHENKALVKAAHQTFLCLLKSNAYNDHSVDFLSDTTNYELTFNTIMEVLRINTSKVKDLVSTFLVYAPYQTTDALLKLKPEMIEESFCFYSYLMCEEAPETTTNYLDSYIEEKYSYKYEEYKNYEAGPTLYLVEHFSDYVPIYFKQIESMRHSSPNEEHFLKLTRVTAMMLNSKIELKEEFLLTALKLANDLSQKPMAFTMSIRKLWRAMMRTEQSTLFIFKNLFEMDVTNDSVDSCLSECPQQYLGKVVESIQTMMENLLIQRPTIKISKQRIKIFKMLSQTPITPKLLYIASVFLTSKVPILYYTSKRKLLMQLGDITDKYKNSIELLQEVYKKIGEETIQYAKTCALQTFVLTRDKDIFRGIAIFLLASASVYPSTNFDQIIQRTTEVVRQSFNDVSDFDKFFSNLFTAFRDSVDVHPIPVSLFNSLLRHGISLIENGFPHVNEAIAQLFISASRHGYFDETNSHLLEESFRLMLYGDRIYASLVSSVIDRIKYDTIQDSTAKVWAKILNCTQVLSEEILTKHLLSSFMRAVVFGDFIIPQKLSILFRTKSTIPEPGLNKFVKKFGTFLMSSNEVSPWNAITLLTAITTGCGQFEMLPKMIIHHFKNITKVKDDSFSFESSN
ncbi:hypothetical protein TVAG_319560 [Trichomonas vaginalis G3]|uniref:Uncharacterized protein n=1 Tax=Trichomonas vaginalis (strain ATCC PRA-98 / G3) TaxID=412133 RepID=A2DQA4_TRIV3|nr:hypothetical protein TVAGG3_1009350 [Trichomonas vaginalis G3]EAY17361.1 hypothetical protein TVAG_319560 [Trichomonas vaginalis G3]KAI5491369.1 hypothetical protein TVAGG3_1009350 [Trichomonas vaginalis G3]|eukprot:XP_001330730.1 hypothetical protein [Trichomonas vaginalis G3]